MKTMTTYIATLLIAACAIVAIPSGAAALDWSDDFDDGDFTSDPTWIEDNHDDHPGIVEITGTDNYVRFWRDAPWGNGGGIELVHALNLGVTNETSVMFDVNPVFSNVGDGAGWHNGEYPIEVRLHLRNATGDELQLAFCYNYRGGASLTEPEFIRVAFPDCAQDVWLRDEEFVIRDYFPQAETITSITLAARGWDFEGYADNVQILDAEPGEPESGFLPSVNGFYFSNTETSGRCLGMVLAADYYFRSGIVGIEGNPDCNAPEVTCPSPSDYCDWPSLLSPLGDHILRMQNSWFPDAFAAVLGHLASWGFTQSQHSSHLQEHYSDVRERLATTGEPVPIIVEHPPNPLFNHELLVYKVEEVGSTKEMFVYDPNYPDCDTWKILLYIDGDGWHMAPYVGEYEMFGTMSPFSLYEISPLYSVVMSPVDLELIAPDGSVINKNVNEIGDARYFEEDFDGDGELDKNIVLDYPEAGTYRMMLHPYPDAPSDARFSLLVMASGDTLLSLVDQEVGAINPAGYEVVLAHAGASAACPRAAGFWQQQCRDIDCSHGEGGAVKFDCTDMDLITAGIDARSSHFTWDDDFASFCATIDPARPIDARKQAKRQFAALLANVCVGYLGLVAGNGDIVSLPESTPILSGCEGMGSTVGDAIDYVDARLNELEQEPLDEVRPEYVDLVCCLDLLNNAMNIEFDPYACVAGRSSVEDAFADRGLLDGYHNSGDEASEPAHSFVHPTPNPFGETTTISYAVGGVPESKLRSLCMTSPDGG